MKSRTLRAVIAPALVLALSACGDDGDSSANYSDPAPATQTQKDSAEGALTGTTELKTLATSDPTNADGVGKVSAIYGNVNALVATKQAAQAQGAPTSAAAGAQGATGIPGMATGGLLAAYEGALDATCVTTDGTKITYNACDFGMATMDGTIDYKDPTVTVNLKIGVATSGVTSNVDYSGAVDVTATAITGSLSFTSATDVSGATAGLAGGQGVSATTTADATYDVTLTDGCATGGSIEVHSVTSVSGGSIPSGAGGVDVWVKALFGPACGDVQIQ